MSTHVPAPPDGRQSERSVAELSRDLTHQATELVRQEVELAKAELSAKGKQAGAGAGMFGGAGVLGFYAFGAFTAAAIAGLATVLDTWLAALAIGVLYVAIAGIVALMGKRRVKRAGPPVPEQTIETVKEDVEWMRTRAQQARSH